MNADESEHPIEDMTDDELLTQVDELAVNSRLWLVGFVRYLIEVERRDLHLRKACSSLTEFCRQKFNLTFSEAHRRVRCVRIAKQFPVVIEMIERGEVTLSSVVRVGKRLTKENHRELLASISNRTQEEVGEILATRFPRGDIPTNVRHNQPFRAPRKERLSGESYRVSLTLSRETMGKLERATRLMSHSNPQHDFVKTLDCALDELLDRLESKVLAVTDHPREKSMGVTERVSRQARRTAFERDGEQCSFVSDDGVRCVAKSFLQVDHVHPRGKGGKGTPDNTRVLCSAHNQFLAREGFGREYVKRRIAESRAQAPLHSKGLLAVDDQVTRPDAPPGTSSISRVSSEQWRIEAALADLVAPGKRVNGSTGRGGSRAGERAP